MLEPDTVAPCRSCLAGLHTALEEAESHLSVDVRSVEGPLPSLEVPVAGLRAQASAIDSETAVVPPPWCLTRLISGTPTATRRTGMYDWFGRVGLGDAAKAWS